MAKCVLCGREFLVSKSLSVCGSCLKNQPTKALEIVRENRFKWRISLGLPEKPPRDEKGLTCTLCVNQCVIPPGSRGFCGVRVNIDNKLSLLRGFDKLLLYAYLDPIPTNCVAAHICPASTGAGYPRYAYSPGVEYGYYNLAVFMAGCPLDCVFCQNWEHKTAISRGQVDTSIIRIYSIQRLVEEAMDPRISCICYFGGDPTPHAPQLIAASREIIKRAREMSVIKRICWETNGLAHPAIIREMARLSLVSGGIIKIDWKAWTPSIYEALTGVDGEKAVSRLKENTKIIIEMSRERPEIPLLVVSILLVPGYVDAEEVRMISEYIASLDPNTPIVLLAFHPDHLMRDLPPTSRRHMAEAVRAAREAGIKNIYIGNEWVLV